MILVPTRELALQTAQVAKELGKYLKVRVCGMIPGSSLTSSDRTDHDLVSIGWCTEYGRNGILAG